MTGAGLSITGHLAGLRESVYATDERSEELEELKSTLGEGPGVDALDGHGAVLVPDLNARDSEARWPIFTPAAVERGVAAMFALPIRAGAARIGVLDLYHDQASELDGAQLADALAYADAALSLTLDLHGGITPKPAKTVDEIFTERRAEVHQASGMMSVQLDVSVADALARLRAHAFAQSRLLRDVAADVVARRLRFTKEAPPDLGVWRDNETADETKEGEAL